MRAFREFENDDVDELEYDLAEMNGDERTLWVRPYSGMPDKNPFGDLSSGTYTVDVTITFSVSTSPGDPMDYDSELEFSNIRRMETIK